MSDGSSGVSVQPGDVEIKSISLTNSSGGKIDLNLQSMGFSIFESIFSPCISAEFIMFDTLDLLHKFPIIGEEKLSVEFKTAGFANSANYAFVTHSVENHAPITQQRVKSYSIKCSTPEGLKNHSTLVNKRFKSESSSIITQIIKDNLGSSKKVVVDQSKGIQDVLLAKMKPLQAIDMIRRRSVSQKYQSASYCFFENMDGFNFTTLEYLADVGKGKIGDKKFIFNTGVPVDFADTKTQNFRTIIGFRNLAMFHNATKVGMGTLKNLTRKFDLLTGKVEDVPYDDSQASQFKWASANAQSLSSSTFKSQYGQDTSVNLLVPKYSALPENYTADYAGKRQAYVTRMLQNRYHVMVWGDSNLRCGDVITMTVPKNLGLTEEDSELLAPAPLVSGNFLITKLRHMISTPTIKSRRYYTTTLELAKGFYENGSVG